jgi:hypothetical protein
MANTPALVVTFDPSTPVAERLAYVWGREWLRLSEADRALLVRDCTEEGGVTDFARYRLDIGTGNLDSYVRTQRVRFAPKAVR